EPTPSPPAEATATAPAPEAPAAGVAATEASPPIATAAAVPAIDLNAEACIMPTIETIAARLLFNDLGKTGAGIFVRSSIITGQTVTLVVNEPFQARIKARVVWCQPQMGSRILSEVPFGFRAGLEFLRDSQKEIEAVDKYVDNILTLCVFKTGSQAA
ncbi:MAG: PilZ domain-containing protein, partial [Bdellovibrionota bacterium]